MVLLIRRKTPLRHTAGIFSFHPTTSVRWRTAMLLFIPRSLCALKRVAAKTELVRFGGTNWERKKAIVSFARLRASLAFGHGGMQPGGAYLTQSCEAVAGLSIGNLMETPA